MYNLVFLSRRPEAGLSCPSETHLLGPFLEVGTQKGENQKVKGLIHFGQLSGSSCWFSFKLLLFPGNPVPVPSLHGSSETRNLLWGSVANLRGVVEDMKGL